MTARETLDQVVASLPEERIQQLLDYANYLRWAEERQEWRQFGQAQLARAYGPNEPDYTEADLQRKAAP